MEENKKYMLYKARWFVLGAYCLHCLSVVLTSTCFTSVSNILQYYFNMKPTAIHMLAIVFGACLLLFTLPAAYFLHKFELAATLKVSAILNLTGATIRFFSYHENYGYILLLLGNIFSAISYATSVILNTKLAQNWFPVDERGTAIGIGNGFDLLSTGIGFILGTQIIRNNKNKENIKSDLQTLNVVLLIAACFSFAALIFVKSKPKTPPSSYEQDVMENQNLLQPSMKVEAGMMHDLHKHTDLIEHIPDYLEIVKKLLQHRNLIRIIHVIALMEALEASYEMMLNDILVHKFPGTEKYIGIVGFIAVVLGFVTNIITGIIIDKTRAFKTVSYVIFGLTLVFMLSWMLLLQFCRSFIIVCIPYCMMLMTSTSYFTVGMTYLMETTYPIDSGISNMISSIAESFYVMIIAIILSHVLVYVKVLYVNVICILVVLMAIILTMFMTPVANPLKNADGVIETKRIK